MQQRLLEDYIQKVQRLVIVRENDPKARQELVDLIAQLQQKHQAPDPLQELLEGENAFFDGQYKRALKHYSHVKDAPFFSFFWNRASAFVLRDLGHLDQAIQCAQKALQERSDDYSTLKILKQLLDQTHQEEEASAVEKQLHALEQPAEDYDFSEEESFWHPAMGLEAGGESAPSPELTELQHLLNSNPSAPLWKPSPPQTGYEAPFEGSAIEQRLRSFERQQADKIACYFERSEQRPNLEENLLCVLNGWEDVQKEDELAALLPDPRRAARGGYYLRWNGKGIVINPGYHFLERFHAQGYFIKDIDLVIVTRAQEDSHAEIQNIHALNHQHNIRQPQLHIIQYYLHQQAHQDLAPLLKPHFKQERNSVHSLELYLDSPEAETVTLTAQIVLHYFHLGGQTASLGLRLELLPSSNQAIRTPLSFGFLSKMPWSPLLTQHLHGCDLVLGGFEATDVEDFGRIKLTQNGLGYFGSYSLADEVRPKLLLCCEFDGAQGDARLEILKKLRNEYAFQQPDSTCLMAADIGMRLHLESLCVYCSLTQALIPPHQVRIAKSSDAFGILRYLSPDTIV